MFSEISKDKKSMAILTPRTLIARPRRKLWITVLLNDLYFFLSGGVSLLRGLTSSIISEIFWIWLYLYLHLYMRKFQQIKFLTFTILLPYGSLNNIVLCCLFSTFIKMELHCMYSFVSHFFCSVLCI